ncbi:MAG: ATP-binding protein [Elusimicrobia bacterium]|nr:ATP-binding protein [Elusimicrobiota bacterium]
MNVREINQALSSGQIDQPGILPHRDQLQEAPYVFPFDFGLSSLPQEPGLILVRGARQYGKSTWLEEQVWQTIRDFGPGSCFYLNGDEIQHAQALSEAIRELIPLYASRAKVRRLFIDEIIAIENWEQSVKRLIDAGELRSALVVTTGSKARDLRRGTERLPGRKGRLSRTTYLFTPVSYRHFKTLCGDTLGDQTLTSYLLSGGSPAALGQLASKGYLPEYVVESMRDWIYGECAASGRSRASLLAILECLLRHGGSPVGQAKLARETGLSNNTVAAGYLDLLADLSILGTVHAWDCSRQVHLMRRPSKFALINLLCAVAWHPTHLRTVQGYQQLDETTQGAFLEWLIAQELWRRAARDGKDLPERLAFWSSNEHELDYVVQPDLFIEVKKGKTSPLEFSWFPKNFPQSKLWVINTERYETSHLVGLTFEDFLLAESRL